jgi:hypothetical protein
LGRAIHDGLLKVGFDVAPSRGPRFPRDHAPDLTDLFIAPTIGFDQFIDAFCRLLGLAMLGHTGPICIAPLVGEAAAGVQGGRAGCADVAAGSLGVAWRSQRGHREPQGKHSQRFLQASHD